MAGRRKASVLPLPVRAAPRTSRPARRMGMEADWMGVVWVKPISERARSVGEHSGSELNGILVVVVADVESEGRDVDASCALVCKLSSF
jgi:hypothetical protein